VAWFQARINAKVQKDLAFLPTQFALTSLMDRRIKSGNDESSSLPGAAGDEAIRPGGPFLLSAELSC
jgi:hypothetical protein